MTTEPTVRRRRVFYIPGFDPIHPRRYRELYRREGAAQAALSGYELALKPRRSKGPYGWHVAAQVEGARVETDVEVLVWSDIVRESMGQGILGTYWQLARTAWAYIGSGALFRLMRLRKGPILAALYPEAMLLAQLALACLAAWGVGALVALALPGWVGWLAGLAVIPPVLVWFRRQDHRLYAYYLMHDFAYTARDGGAYPPELTARMEAFRQSIAEALASGADEVLVVGHSSGAHIAVTVLADLLRAGRAEGGAEGGPVLSLLTLGQAIPMASFLPRADKLRGDLHYLSASDALTWVDVTAPGDGCAFALCDPVAVTGVAPPDKRWPLVLSAAFSQTLSPAKQAELKRRYFRLHFQYMCAFDALPGTPADYDYFRITAGPQTLGARFADRAPSKSRIETPVGRHVTMAA
ncbi:hypothetical protein [Ruixingdingia sedimenti]|uniref:Uncharacterized protein n=1 Tax=Ruixingdingia sedimenti TaxID=3073604 RepID=A0ABU1F4Z5_9RHOB|nr:hypothetical protein [Xinfangfangia sp. LG-4]MDR5651946.1 hypothetical protein [Xinfangfangia sp. LG-4]